MVVVVTWGSTFVKTHVTLHLPQVHFIYKLYLHRVDSPGMILLA